MTTLTMEQRRADFEVMLKRANMARATVSRWRATEINVPGKSLAGLARDVAELCSAWVSAAHRAHAHNPGDHAQTRALAVAVDCLQAITENEEEACGIPVDDLLKAMADDAATYFGENPDWPMDLGIDPCLRVQSLLRTLGDLAACWPVADDLPSPFGTDTYEQQFSALFGLLFEAICAALAAERGLWQEEAA